MSDTSLWRTIYDTLISPPEETESSGTHEDNEPKDNGERTSTSPASDFGKIQ